MAELWTSGGLPYHADGMITTTDVMQDGHPEGSLTPMALTGVCQSCGSMEFQERDPGVERVRVFHSAFGAVIHEEPWMPELSPADRHLVQHWGISLAMHARQLKAQAAEANETGRAGLGLLLVRLQLLVEETGELADAWARGDLVEVLDALSDISCVTDGTYLTHGLGSVKVRADEEVHRSNMSKLGEDGRPIIHESGRVVKGPRYSPPDLRAVLEGREGGA